MILPLNPPMSIGSYLDLLESILDGLFNRIFGLLRLCW